jgi:hypothetical protein
MSYSIHPYINYITTHLVLTLFFHLYPNLLDPKGFDTILFPLDALVRTSSVTSAVSLLSSQSPTSIHPALIQSPLTHFIVGALASSGGGILAFTFSTWSSSWSFSTPPLLRAGVGLWGSVDFWGGGIVAIIYGIVTRHEAFTDAAAVLEGLGFMKMKGLGMEPLQAKALAAGVLTILFGVRVLMVHWTSKAGSVEKTSSEGRKRKA